VVVAFLNLLQETYKVQIPIPAGNGR